MGRVLKGLRIMHAKELHISEEAIASVGVRKHKSFAVMALLMTASITASVGSVSFINFLESSYTVQDEVQRMKLNQRLEARVEHCRQMWPSKGDRYNACVRSIVH